MKGFSNLKNIYGMASACSALKRVDLTGCTSITNSREAFLDCTALEEVILPGTMTLSSRVFRNCTALRKIDFTAWSGDEAPSLPGDAFDGISDLKAVSVYVTEDKYDLFASDSEWQKFTLVKISSTGITSPVVEDGTSSRRVYSVNGSVVRTLKAGEGVNSLPKGIYIINKKKYQVK